MLQVLKSSLIPPVTKFVTLKRIANNYGSQKQTDHANHGKDDVLGAEGHHTCFLMNTKTPSER